MSYVFDILLHEIAENQGPEIYTTCLTLGIRETYSIRISKQPRLKNRMQGRFFGFLLQVKVSKYFTSLTCLSNKKHLTNLRFKSSRKIATHPNTNTCYPILCF